MKQDYYDDNQSIWELSNFYDRREFINVSLVLLNDSA